MQICAWCGNEFEASNKELNRGNGRFCSLSCAAFHNNSLRTKNLTTMTCQVCGQTYSVKASSVRNSKYCSRSCLNASKVRDGSYKARADAFSTLPNRCFHCASSEDLLLHHIDGNHLNNDPSNWRIVCRKHHILIEHPEVIENLSHLNTSRSKRAKE